MWQRALARNGLWPVEAQRLSEILPEDLRRLPWVTATIGELAASGLVSEALTMWLAEDGVGQRFLDIGVLLQRGHSVEDLQRLHELNALDPVVHVTAPLRPGATDWDVVDVAVKPGMVLEPGEPLLTLRDSSYLWLQVSPVGGEVATLLAAAQENRTLVARPLVPGAGPTLTGMTLRSLESDRAHGGTLATVRVKNAVHSGFERDGGRSRVWQLRAGLRYVLEVPVQTLDDVFILPTSAVAESGPERVVFLQDGDGFKPVPIVVLYENDQVVVVPKSKHVQLYDGDVIARTGAFELGLALTSGDGVDAHAGHNH